MEGNTDNIAVIDHGDDENNTPRSLVEPEFERGKTPPRASHFQEPSVLSIVVTWSTVRECEPTLTLVTWKV